MFPPGVLDADLWRRAYENMIAAHRKSYDAIKAGRGDFPVGLTLSMSDYQAVPADDAEAARTRDTIRHFAEDIFLEPCRGDDFIGVQTYSRTRVGPDGDLGDGGRRARCWPMGYEFYPQALEATIRRAWEVTEHVPVLVTENGIGTDDDDQRSGLRARGARRGGQLPGRRHRRARLHLLEPARQLRMGLRVRPRFGIVDVDRTTQERRPKPSARWLGEVARDNGLTALTSD